MAAGAPLIPEGALGIAAIADLLIALLDLLALVVLLGMLWVYKQTLGALIGFLVQHTSFKVFGHRITPLFPLDAADNFIQSSMSTAALGLEIAGGRFFHALGVIIGWMVNLALYSATTLEHAFHWLVHVYIPGRASWAASVLFPPALIAKLIRSAIAKELPHVGKIAKGAAATATTLVYTPVKVFGRRLSKAEKRIAALAAAIAALGGHVIHPGHTLSLPKSWYGLTKRLARLERRMHRAEGWLAAGALAVAVANMTGTTFKCWRGQGNIARLLRHVCGFPKWIIDLLVLGTVEAFIASDLCQFSNLLIAQTKLIQPVLMDFVDVENALVKCSGVSDLYPLDLPPLSLPPMPAYPSLSV